MRLDPVLFEILRHRLWAINGEAASTVRLVSGSTVATEANDMNTALMNARGEVFAVGNFSLAKATTLSAVVCDIVANYGENPGIHPGDAFICNDPYVGVQHQNDVAYVAPIHWQGELIAWTGVEIHQVDVGGPVAGQVQVGARDIFGEQPLMPPIKLVEGGELRRDLEREYLRRSRLPDLVALDLRAKIAASNVSIRRLHRLIEDFGLRQVCDAMEDILDTVEERFRARLRLIPDGIWRQRTYMDYGDDIYPIVLAVSKHGDTLHCDFTGTAEQAPAVVNATFKSLEAIVRGYACLVLCWDMPWSPSAVGRAIGIEAPEGTVVNVRWPGGVSKSTTSVLWSVGRLFGTVVGKMLTVTPRFKEYSMASWQGAKTVEDLFGRDRRGRYFGAAILDAMAGGGGARTWADGIDTGGYLGSMGVSIANVESYEFEYPILYLFRRQLEDSGGAGRFRGGSGLTKLVVCHGVDEIPEQVMHCVGAEMPLSLGINGGYPSTTDQFVIYRDSDIEQRLHDSRIPSCAEDLGVEPEVHRAISKTSLRRGDVFHVVAMGGGGYGDPLDRDPALVQRDWTNNLVSIGYARSRYGVVLDPQSGNVHAEETASLRASLRTQCRETARPGPAPLHGGQARVPDEGPWLNEMLGTALVDGERVAACRCGLVICGYAENYKDHVLQRRRPIHEIGPHVDPFDLSGGRFEVREFYCPGCGGLIDVEVAQTNEPILRDVELFA